MEWSRPRSGGLLCSAVKWSHSYQLVRGVHGAVMADAVSHVRVVSLCYTLSLSCSAVILSLILSLSISLCLLYSLSLSNYQ